MLLLYLEGSKSAITFVDKCHACHACQKHAQIQYKYNSENYPYWNPTLLGAYFKSMELKFSSLLVCL